MEKYEIIQKSIPKVELVSLTSQNWYDSEHNLIPWSGTTGIYCGPNEGDIVENVTGSTPNPIIVPEGYYKWSDPNHLTWNYITITGSTEEERRMDRNRQIYENHFIPLFLEQTIDDLGVMVGWDGFIQQVEQLCNFTYTGCTGCTDYNGYSGCTGCTTLILSNSASEDALKIIKNQQFKVDWGDGNSTIMTGIVTGITHSYPVTGGTYEVSIYLESSWTTQKLTKTITVPFIDPYNIDNEFGTFTGYTLTGGTTFSQDYLNDLDYNTTGTTYPPTGYTETLTLTGYTGFTYAAIGGSRLDEKKLYGSTTYSGTTIEYDSNLEQYYTGYTIDGFYYRDYPDGYTMITGSTKGTTDIPKEEVPNYCITRNEHFLGFVDEPTIYSDIFVERGKQGVMEKNLRLSEIDNIGELEIYGNGYFNIKKQ